MVVLPVDGIYGSVCVPRRDNVIHDVKENNEIIASELSHIERYTVMSKKMYDFLKRVWPDEVTVILKMSGDADKSIRVRIPESVLSRTILESVGGILIFSPIQTDAGRQIYKRLDIEQLALENGHPVFIIDELCRKHQPPTVIDLRDGRLHLVRQGRVSIDELSSLYFLGSSEDA
jgi:tRNA A37 threonylcarbamoyladenosine synthetase subunit TsaC/SUA5/YrdC